MVTMAKISGQERVKRSGWRGFDQQLDDIRLPKLPQEFVGTDSEDEEEEEDQLRRVATLEYLYIILEHVSIIENF